MNRKQAKKLFLAWHEGRLSAARQQEVEDFLNHDDETRRYYYQMNIFLEESDPGIFPQLEADPFLTTRLRAATQSPAGLPAAKKKLAVPVSLWAFSSALLILAVTIGFYLGIGLSEPSLTTDEVANAYYAAFSQQSVSQNWGDLILNDSEDMP